MKKKIHIAFLRYTPQVRIYKLAKALALTGNYEITIMGLDKPDDVLYKDVSDRCLSTYMMLPTILTPTLTERIKKEEVPFQKVQEDCIRSLVRAVDADIYYAMGEPNWVPRAVMEATNKPVIYDVYDYTGLQCGVDKLSKNNREDEQYCMENATAIVNKCSEDVLDYFRSFGYKITCPYLEYHDYCDEDLFQPIDLKQEKPKEWQMVYAGSSATEKESKLKGGHGGFHNFARGFAKQGIHFHIYPNPFQDSQKDFSCYHKIEKETPYFHLHTPLPFKKFSKEISIYHFGFASTNKAPQLTWDYWKIGITGKLSTYLEAGIIPIFSEEQEAMATILKENNIGPTFPLNKIETHLIDYLNQIPWKETRINLQRFRSEYSISKQSHRLDSFIKESKKIEYSATTR